MKSIEKRASFDFIRYGSVWEDADVLCQALKPRAKGGRLLSIASAGGNALALLTLDPKEVVAADLNPAQLACLEIRLAAFQALSYPHLLEFLGVKEDSQRLRTYQKLRRRLSRTGQDFWDAQPEIVAKGVIHAGKLEKFLRAYQWLLLRLVHSPENIQNLLKPKDLEAQLHYYDKVWNTWAWRLLNRVAFSKTVLGLWGRDPEFFRHTGVDVTSGPNQRLGHAMTRLPTSSNPYLSYHLTGNYSPSALPKFLRPQHFQAIRSRCSRVKLFLGKVEDAPGTFDGFNLSNIFEYMDSAQHIAAYERLISKARPKARLAYWNLHVRRRLPESAKKRVLSLDGLGKKLHARDKSWAYRSFHVDALRALR